MKAAWNTGVDWAHFARIGIILFLIVALAHALFTMQIWSFIRAIALSCIGVGVLMVLSRDSGRGQGRGKTAMDRRKKAE